MEYIENIDVDNKRVILRLDLNVTIQDGQILDDTKIRKSIPTIKYLLDRNANLLIMSHLGKVKTEEDKKTNSLRIVSEKLESLLGIPVNFITSTSHSEELESATKNHRISLMENTRFEDIPNKLESSCDEKLSEYWASLGEVFINDAFGTTHRKHASNYGISKYLPSAYGFLIKEELDGLKPITNNPKKPFTVIMGGAKVDDKITLIESLLKECDYLLVGGGIANTFLESSGYPVGASLYSRDYVSKIHDLLETYKNKIFMPVDVTVKNSEEIKTSDIQNVGENDTIYDIGPKTILKYKKIMETSKTIFMNGTMGLYEDEHFKNGTIEIYQTVQNLNAYVIAGGGDAVASINNLGFADSFDFLSTGGGATLEYLANKKVNCFEEN